MREDVLVPCFSEFDKGYTRFCREKRALPSEIETLREKQERKQANSHVLGGEGEGKLIGDLETKSFKICSLEESLSNDKQEFEQWFVNKDYRSDQNILNYTLQKIFWLLRQKTTENGTAVINRRSFKFCFYRVTIRPPFGGHVLLFNEM